MHQITEALLEQVEALVTAYEAELVEAFGNEGDLSVSLPCKVSSDPQAGGITVEVGISFVTSRVTDKRRQLVGHGPGLPFEKEGEADATAE